MMLSQCRKSRLLCTAPLLILSCQSFTLLPTLVQHHHQQHLSSTLRQKSRTPSVACHLFFRSGERTMATSAKRIILDPDIFNDLESPALSLPYSITLADDYDDSEVEETLTIRCMEPKDLDEVLKICVDEFGTGPTAGIGDLPLSDPQSLPDWWDKCTFEPSIRLALKAKIRNNSRNSSAKQNDNSATMDPAILVLCRQVQNEQSKVVGLVEVSLQIPEPDKNPPTYPRPLGLKEFYSRIKGLELQGWVTNLLIDPNYRGLGYSKLLMAATEGIARSWDREYIYLHADADYKSGRIPQQLYKNIGYEVVVDEDPQYEWMPKSTFSSLRMVQGVALLFYRKRL